MEDKREEHYSLTDLMETIRLFLRHYLKKWWLLVLAVLIGSGLGATYYFIQKSKYEAVTTFILEEKSSGGGGLAGLASQFGFNLGSLSGGGSIFAGDNILDILQSKKVVEQVLLSKVDETSANNTTLADYYLEFMGIKKKWENKPSLAGLNFGNTKTQLNLIQDSVLNRIYIAITKDNLSVDHLNKKGTIIKVEVTAANSHFARLLTERLVDEASKLYLNIRIGTAQENIRQLQRRSDSLLSLLNNKSYHAAASQPLDINPGLKTAIVPVEIATRDKTVLATLYAEVTKNLEASKLLLSQQTPVIQLLDRPGYLLEDKKKGLFLLIVIMSIVTGFFYTIGSFLLFLLKANKG